MKSKLITSALSLTLVLSLALTGCNKPTTSAETSGVENKVPNSAITVLDIKKKYGLGEEQTIMPMYNVEKDKEFIFNFKSDMKILPSTAPTITVHTDIKCQDSSKILSLASTYNSLNTGITIPEGYKSQIVIAPMQPVLPSDKGSRDNRRTWGNAPTYYIKLNYDMESSEVKRLGNPVIIPFTVKSDVPVPTLKKSISPDGRLKLSWGKVDGADKYIIYKSTSGASPDVLSNSSEKGFKGVELVQEAITTDVEWDDFAHDGNHALGLQNETIVTTQNNGVSGEYFVVAMSGDTQSAFSFPVNTTFFSDQLPLKINPSDNILLKQYDNVTQLPQKVEILLINGTIQQRDVIYDLNVTPAQSGDTNLNFKISGTALKGYVRLVHFDDTLKDALKSMDTADSSSGYVLPATTIDTVPEPDVPTIIPDKAQDLDKTAKKQDITNSETSSEITVEQQKENTKKQVAEADEAVVPEFVVEKDIEINAENALQEFLARNLMNGHTDISLKAFPEAQNYVTLRDNLEQVIYQNPLILGVTTIDYDYSTLTLHVDYKIPVDVITKQQQEIVLEAKSILSFTIKPDMSSEQKSKALYDYLDRNTKYDINAFKNAEKSNFETVDPTFNNSFTTFGVMIKKIGLCTSYASTYKMLCDLSGVDCVVVTGYLGSVPHVWNKVKINDEWVNIDPTNNSTNTGVPYMLYGASDKTAEDNAFSFDNSYWVDKDIPDFIAKTNRIEHYTLNGLEVQSVDAYKTKLTNMLKNGEKSIIVRFSTKINQELLMEATAQVFTSVAKDKVSSVKMGNLGNYIIIRL